MVADTLILRGAVSVDEAILTGESVPLHKEAPGLDSPLSAAAPGHTVARTVSPKAQSDWLRTNDAHIVFSGTRLLAHSSGGTGSDDEDDDSDEELDSSVAAIAGAEATVNLA